MAFIVDRENFRTYDPERGYELFVTGGGSDGTSRFRLVGPDGETTFSAHSFGERLRPDELRRLGSDYAKKPVVWMVHLWLKEWKSVIRDALIEHSSYFPDEEVFVRFGTKESVFDV